MVKLNHKTARDLLVGLAMTVPVMVGCTHHSAELKEPALEGMEHMMPEDTPPEGTWSCIAEWSHERNGVKEPCSAQQQITCADHALVTTGVISIGAAQWSVKKQGTCYADGDQLYGTWASVDSVPKNDEARRFEQERFGGESLATVSKQVGTEHRVRVTSRTQTEFQAVDAKGQVISCTRP